MKSGWFSINHYILNNGTFNSGENWLLRGGLFDGRSTIGVSLLMSMAMRGNGHSHQHAGIKPTFLMINLLTEQAAVCGQVYKELSTYCDLAAGTLTDINEQKAYIDGKLSALGFTLEMITFKETFTVDIYNAFLADQLAKGNTVIATLIDNLPYVGDSTAELQPLFDAGDNIIQLLTVGPAVTSTDPKMTGMVDIRVEGGSLVLVTNKVGITNNMVIPVDPSPSANWERDPGNVTLIETE